MLTRGMEEVTQGMIAMRAMQDVVSNNLANANTPGFQEDTLLVSDFNHAYAAALEEGEGNTVGYSPAGGGVSGETRLLFKTVTKFSPGKLKSTGEPFDLAIDGKGFFTIQARDGIHFTRNGNFTINGEGYLVNREGGLVLGERGPIKLSGDSFKVKTDGTILVDKKTVDQIRISWIDPKELSKVGSTDFKAVNPLSWHATDRPKIMQGFIEMSNVNAVKEMVQMIAIMRAFEAQQKLLQTQDQMRAKANQIAQTSK